MRVCEWTWPSLTAVHTGQSCNMIQSGCTALTPNPAAACPGQLALSVFHPLSASSLAPAPAPDPLSASMSLFICLFIFGFLFKHIPRMSEIIYLL